MRIALIGATGFVGTAVVAELLQRGHDVTALVRNPELLAPCERTGKYRVGGEALLMAGPAPAGISVADLAVAIVDEIETPRHVRVRFTVATA